MSKEDTEKGVFDFFNLFHRLGEDTAEKRGGILDEIDLKVRQYRSVDINAYLIAYGHMMSAGSRGADPEPALGPTTILQQPTT